MAVHRAKNMTTAKKQAMMARRRGFKASIFRKKNGMVMVSVTRG